MIERAIELSLIITAIHVCMMPGMIFGFIGNFFDKNLPEILKKPIFSCLICMGGIYSLLLYPLLYTCFDLLTIKTMLMVIGINTLIANLIKEMYE